MFVFSQVFNPAFPPALTPNSSSNSAARHQQQQQQQQQQQAFMPQPFMDPSYMAYMMMMAAAQPPPPFAAPFPMAVAASHYANPYMDQRFGGGGGSALSLMSMAQRPPLQDDQQSIQSFHFEADPRRPNFMTPHQHPHPHLQHMQQQSSAPNRPQSVSGGSVFEAQQQQPQQQQQSKQQPQSTLLDTSHQVSIKREEVSASARLTPVLHQIPHVRACFSLSGLVQVRANDPCEGQPALVDILSLADMMEHYMSSLRRRSTAKSKRTNDDPTNNELNNGELADDDGREGDHNDDDHNVGDDDDDDEDMERARRDTLANYKLLQDFPGPLLYRESTVKAQVIQFCQRSMRECAMGGSGSGAHSATMIDPQSHALLWDYLSLLVRQNGCVDLKTDVASLLLTGIQSSDAFSSSSANTGTAISASVESLRALGNADEAANAG